MLLMEVRKTGENNFDEFWVNNSVHHDLFSKKANGCQGDGLSSMSAQIKLTMAGT